MRNVEAIAAEEIPRILRAWLDGPVEAERGHEDHGADLVARSQGQTLVFQVKRADDVALLEGAFHQLEAYTEAMGDAVPVLVVPYMGPKAKDYVGSKGLSWMDLSGNADIRGPGLRILVEGRPNRFASPGRPSTAFSPKASRLTRAMLVEPKRWWLQAELAEATQLSAGYVSKVVSRLDEDELVERADEGRLRPRSPSLLLDAWSQVYSFGRHEVSHYHAVGRTGAAVLKSVAGKLKESGNLTWAATGLAAAWQLDRFADFRLVTLFVSKPVLDPSPLGLRPVEKGENVWVVVPKDDGVFHGGKKAGGVQCVHPVQVYLDLLGHPERAKEAASHLRSHRLGWTR